MDHDEINEDTWKKKEQEWLSYLINNVLSSAFLYARYSKGMEGKTGFGMKKSKTFASLAHK